MASMLSQKARYALKAMLFLAQHKGEGPVMIGEIAEQQSVPKKFLELILLDLKKRGLVHSIRGRSGGYVLGRQREDISFAEIIRVIDGPLALAPCASRTAFRKCEDCDDVETCAIRKHFSMCAIRRQESWNPEPWRKDRQNVVAQNQPNRRSII
jgi:Rrf2 family protein